MSVRVVAIASSLLLLACGGAAPLQTAPSSPPPSPAEPVADVAADSADAPNDARTAEHDGVPGVSLVDESQQLTSLQPVTVDLSQLPIAAIPEPLATEDVPKELPKPRTATKVTLEGFEHFIAGADPHGAVTLQLDPRPDRRRLGTIVDEGHGSHQMVRHCGRHEPIAAIRWQTLSVNKHGAIEYRIVDGWFDPASCEVSVVRETLVKPKALLGSMVFAFRGRCDGCPSGDTINFVTPLLSRPAVSSVGGTVTASHGTISLVQLPIRHGGAAAFEGQLNTSLSLAHWLDAIIGADGTTRDNRDQRWLYAAALETHRVVIGGEVQRGVMDDEPLAIAYASLTGH